MSNCACVQGMMEGMTGHTSSRFDIFALLALSEEEAVSLCTVSNFGLGIGMLDGLSVKPV